MEGVGQWWVGWLVEVYRKSGISWDGGGGVGEVGNSEVEYTFDM